MRWKEIILYKRFWCFFLIWGSSPILEWWDLIVSLSSSLLWLRQSSPPPAILLKQPRQSCWFFFKIDWNAVRLQRASRCLIFRLALGMEGSPFTEPCLEFWETGNTKVSAVPAYNTVLHNHKSAGKCVWYLVAWKRPSIPEVHRELHLFTGNTDGKAQRHENGIANEVALITAFANINSRLAHSSKCVASPMYFFLPFRTTIWIKGPATCRWNTLLIVHSNPKMTSLNFLNSNICHADRWRISMGWASHWVCHCGLSNINY